MSTLSLETPHIDDGLPVWRLVRDTGILDLNSTYAYCATFRHFPQTCVVARVDGALAGFVAGYRLPARPEVLFVWQVGVGADHRGRGLATTMLRHLLLQAPGTAGVTHLETTITPDNAASRALFEGLARKLETSCEVSPCLSAEQLGEGHAPEELFRIGPIPRNDS